MSSSAVTYDFPEPGCYADGCRGVDGAGGQNEIVFSLAESYGWIMPAVAPEEEADDFVDDAIEYLQSLETREGYWWGFDNGDFGLWTEDVSCA